MSFDAFLFFDTIRGESLDEQNEDAIELLSYNFGMHNPGKISASTAGGASTGRVEVSSFTFTKLIDAASCKLLEASCSGQHFEKVTLRLHRAGGDKLRYFEVELEQVMITDFNQSGHQGTPVEAVQLSYGKINTTYTRQDRHTGEAMGALSGGWDLIQNRHYA